MRSIVPVGVAVAILGSLWSLHAQSAQGPSNMGGIITGGLVTMLEEGPKPAIAHARYDPGARTKWHSHDGGQIVLSEEGVTWTQVKGGPIIELKAGEVAYAPPGAVHWHGAAPDRGCVQYNVTRGKTTWGDEVTDQEYRVGPPKK